jgi:hypothetical protein
MNEIEPDLRLAGSRISGQPHDAAIALKVR